VSFRLVPTLKRVWFPKGRQPEGTFWWSKAKLNLFGALIDGKEMYYEWYDRLNTVSFLSFMQRFVATLDTKRKYVFIFDNAPAHKSKKAQHYLAALPKNLFVEFLPPYSPQLNAIETCWKIVRYHVTNSTVFESLWALQSGLELFLDNYNFTLNVSNYLVR
jgi:transposase